MPSAHLLLSVAIAITLGVLAVIRAMRAAGHRLDPSGEALDTTPLQRVARASLISTAAFAGPGLGVLLIGGVDGWQESAGQRILVTVLSLMGVGAATLPILITRRAADQGRLVLDERDLTVLQRAPEAQSWALVVALTAWTIGLTEHFAQAGAVPLPWLSAAFFTMLVVWALALPLGIVIGYRRD